MLRHPARRNRKLRRQARTLAADRVLDHLDDDVLAFAKAIGEFGATITFVSNIPGQTQTLPSAIYAFLQVPGGEAAAARMVAIAIVVAMAATAYVLVKGVIAMASGKDIGGVKQQKAMRQRVFYQAIAIVIVMLILLLARSNG